MSVTPRSTGSKADSAMGMEPIGLYAMKRAQYHPEVASMTTFGLGPASASARLCARAVVDAGHASSWPDSFSRMSRERHR